MNTTVLYDSSNNNTLSINEVNEAIELYLKKNTTDIIYPIVRQLSSRKYTDAKEELTIDNKIVDISHDYLYDILDKNKEYRYLVQYKENQYYDVLKRNNTFVVIDKVIFN